MVMILDLIFDVPKPAAKKPAARRQLKETEPSDDLSDHLVDTNPRRLLPKKAAAKKKKAASDDDEGSDFDEPNQRKPQQRNP